MQKNASGFAENLLKPYKDYIKQAPLSRYLIITLSNARIGVKN
jgi:hypothetical protein